MFCHDVNSLQKAPEILNTPAQCNHTDHTPYQAKVAVGVCCAVYVTYRIEGTVVQQTDIHTQRYSQKQANSPQCELKGYNL